MKHLFKVVFSAMLCLGSFASAKDSLDISFTGSSTITPVIAKISNEFSKKYKTWDKVDNTLANKEIKIYVSSGGSGAGVKAVLDNVTNFGMVSRNLKESEKEKLTNLKSYLIGIDALSVAVNPNNKLIEVKNGNLSKAEIIKIFSGEFKKWSDLDPRLPDDEIVVVTRDLAGGAHEVFQKNIMGDVKVSKNVIQAPSMGALVAKIIENKNAIGYASVGITNQNKGKLVPLKIDSIEPSRENILNHTYYVSRPLLVIKNGDLSKAEQILIDLLLSKEGQEIVENLGFIPAK